MSRFCCYIALLGFIGVLGIAAWVVVTLLWFPAHTVSSLLILCIFLLAVAAP